MRPLIIAAVVSLIAIPTQAGPSTDVTMSVVGMFKIFWNGAIANSGTFEADGAIHDSGSTSDVSIEHFPKVSIDRTITTSKNDVIKISMHGVHKDSSYDPPDWCPQPPPRAGTVIFQVTGNWTVVSGTGKYKGLAGDGRWVSHVYVDRRSGLPFNNMECLRGNLHFN